MGLREISSRAAEPDVRPPQHLLHHRRMIRGETGAIKADPPRRVLEADLAPRRGGRLSQEAQRRAQRRRRAREHRVDARLELRPQERQQPGADPVAQEARVVVGRVLAPRPAGAAEAGAQLRTRDRRAAAAATEGAPRPCRARPRSPPPRSSAAAPSPPGRRGCGRGESTRRRSAAPCAGEPGGAGGAPPLRESAGAHGASRLARQAQREAAPVEPGGQVAHPGVRPRRTRAGARDRRARRPGASRARRPPRGRGAAGRRSRSRRRPPPAGRRRRERRPGGARGGSGPGAEVGAVHDGGCPRANARPAGGSASPARAIRRNEGVAAHGTRTADPVIMIHLLYQLSYAAAKPLRGPEY